MFYTVIAIHDNDARYLGVYADRVSALEARATMSIRGTPDMSNAESLVVLEWLCLYGYNSVFLPGNDSDMCSDSFYPWVHKKDMPNKLSDSIIQAAYNAFMQWFSMQQAGSFVR